MSERRIAVVFPGVGYHSDKPLLYYTKKLAREQGFEVIEITYEFPFRAREIKDDRDKMKEAFDLAVKQTGEQLDGADLAGCGQILFIGKSIGTAVAACYDEKHCVGASHLILTPVPETFDFLRKGCGIVFHGNADPWCDTAVAEKRCRELELPLTVIEGANHSLETKSAVTDARNMADLLVKTESFIQSFPRFR